MGCRDGYGQREWLGFAGTFERGSVRNFCVVDPGFGAVVSLRVGTDGSGWSPSWMLLDIIAQVKTESRVESQAVEFKFHRWIGLDSVSPVIEVSASSQSLQRLR